MRLDIIKDTLQRPWRQTAASQRAQPRKWKYNRLSRRCFKCAQTPSQRVCKIPGVRLYRNWHISSQMF